MDGKNSEAVVRCLLELARLAARTHGIAPPEVVRVEDEVDEAMAAASTEAAALPPTASPVFAASSQAAAASTPAPYRAVANDDVDRRLELLLAQHAHLTGRFERIAFGLYWMKRAGAPPRRIFVRVLFEQVVVRVGGGWEDLVVFAARFP